MSRNAYAVPAVHGEPPTVRYTITDAAIAKLKTIVVHQKEGGEETVLAVYDGGSAAAAITLADYNGMPVGSIIEDIQAHKTHEHNAAATWVSSAARS